MEKAVRAEKQAKDALERAEARAAQAEMQAAAADKKIGELQDEFFVYLGEAEEMEAEKVSASFAARVLVNTHGTMTLPLLLLRCRAAASLLLHACTAAAARLHCCCCTLALLLLHACTAVGSRCVHCETLTGGARCAGSLTRS